GRRVFWVEGDPLAKDMVLEARRDGWRRDVLPDAGDQVRIACGRLWQPDQKDQEQQGAHGFHCRFLCLGILRVDSIEPWPGCRRRHSSRRPPRRPVPDPGHAPPSPPPDPPNATGPPSLAQRWLPRRSLCRSARGKGRGFPRCECDPLLLVALTPPRPR